MFPLMFSSNNMCILADQGVSQEIYSCGIKADFLKTISTQFTLFLLQSNKKICAENIAVTWCYA